jgi:hypothetical protein
VIVGRGPTALMCKRPGSPQSRCGAFSAQSLEERRERALSRVLLKQRATVRGPAFCVSFGEVRLAHVAQPPSGVVIVLRATAIDDVLRLCSSSLGGPGRIDGDRGGLQDVQGEWKLVCAAFNLKHLYARVAACNHGAVAA